MRCIFGLARPDRGEVRWNGAAVDREARLRFGYMPEQRGLYPRMRVVEQLSYFAQQHGMKSQGRDAAGVRWLDRMGLGDRAKSKLEELSHGNQQRVQLAVALAHDPELLVLDEPFSGLDPIGIATMTEVVRDRAAAGVGVIFSATSSTSSRTSARTSSSSPGAASSRPGRSTSSSRAPGAGTSRWRSRAPTGRGSTGAATLTVLERDGDRVKLLVDETSTWKRCSRGRGRRRGPSLRLPAAEAVRAVHGGVASPDAGRGGRAMSRRRSIWLVARREILERGRSRGSS